MIYYFSGSGNSRAVADTLAHLLHCDKQKVGGWALSSDMVLGMVLPVYSWGIPPNVLQWLGRVMLPAQKPEYVWALLDYGDEAGYAPVSYTHLRAHETVLDLVCRLLLEKIIVVVMLI